MSQVHTLAAPGSEGIVWWNSSMCTSTASTQAGVLLFQFSEPYSSTSTHDILARSSTQGGRKASPLPQNSLNIPLSVYIYAHSKLPASSPNFLINGYYQIISEDQWKQRSYWMTTHMLQSEIVQPKLHR